MYFGESGDWDMIPSGSDSGGDRLLSNICDGMIQL